MLPTEIEHQKYPIGKFKAPDTFSKAQIDEWIQTIDELPVKLRSVVKNFDDRQLDTPYRDGGWTVRQVIHHLADSHMNSYIRFKWALTEDLPTIKPYFEKQWAELDDAKHAPVELSLTLLDALHQRWVYFLRKLNSDELKKKFIHPDSKREMELQWVIALYGWHCSHHLAHITSLAERNRWNVK